MRYFPSSSHRSGGEMHTNPNIIEATGITNLFGKNKVHENLNFSVKTGEIIGVVGASGSGKTVLLKTLIGLHTPNAGQVLIGSKNVANMKANEKAKLMGVLFQHGALFSALTVLKNVMAPIQEYIKLAKKEVVNLARLKIAFANLPEDAANKYPSELSGGMIKRASLARALALDPALLFLDEPTSGLDPIAANEFDLLVKDLNRDLGITFVIITHDLDTLASICDRVALLVNHQMIIDTLAHLIVNEDPSIKSYFQGPRARIAFQGIRNGEK